MSHENGFGSMCTGTLIAPNLLLTARHCVSPSAMAEVICDISEFGDPVSGSDVYATNDPIPEGNSSWFQGREVRVPAEGNDTCGFDVALVILAGNVPTAVASPAVPRIDVEVTEGEEYYAVGYGMDESGEPTAGRMILGDLEVQCAPGACGAFGAESTEFMGETGICSGDSGGPALDRDGKVVGVVSRGSGGCETPIYGTVTAWKDWLVQGALDAAAIGGYAPPFWALSGTSDLPGDPSDEEGAACSGPADCGEGFACHYLSDPEQAACRRSCSADADCSEGKTCRPVESSDFGVCLEPSSSKEEAGCAVSGVRSDSVRALFVPYVAFVAALGVLSRRRRRRAFGRR